MYFAAYCAGVTNMSADYNLSHAVKIYRRYWRMKSCSASQNDYRLVTITITSLGFTLAGELSMVTMSYTGSSYVKYRRVILSPSPMR